MQQTNVYTYQAQTPSILQGTNSSCMYCGNNHVSSRKEALYRQSLNCRRLHCKSTDRKISPNISSPKIERFSS